MQIVTTIMSKSIAARVIVAFFLDEEHLL